MSPLRDAFFLINEELRYKCYTESTAFARRILVLFALANTKCANNHFEFRNRDFIVACLLFGMIIIDYVYHKLCMYKLETPMENIWISYKMLMTFGEPNALMSVYVY